VAYQQGLGRDLTPTPWRRKAGGRGQVPAAPDSWRCRDGSWRTEYPASASTGAGRVLRQRPLPGLKRAAGLVPLLGLLAGRPVTRPVTGTAKGPDSVPGDRSGGQVRQVARARGQKDASEGNGLQSPGCRDAFGRHLTHLGAGGADRRRRPCQERCGEGLRGAGVLESWARTIAGTVQASGRTRDAGARHGRDCADPKSEPCGWQASRLTGGRLGDVARRPGSAWAVPGCDERARASIGPSRESFARGRVRPGVAGLASTAMVFVGTGKVSIHSALVITHLRGDPGTSVRWGRRDSGAGRGNRNGVLSLRPRDNPLPGRSARECPPAMSGGPWRRPRGERYPFRRVPDPVYRPSRTAPSWRGRSGRADMPPVSRRRADALVRAVETGTANQITRRHPFTGTPERRTA